MVYLESIIKSGLFYEIAPADYKNAYHELELGMKSFNKGNLIFNEGDVIDHICIVESGSVRCQKHGEDTITQLYYSNEFFGLESVMSEEKRTIMDYISHEDTNVLLIPIDAIMNSVFSNEFKKSLIHKLAVSNEDRLKKINLLVHRTLRERILIFLENEFSRSREAGHELVVKMNQEQLANYLCVNRSALSQELNKMKREKIIDFNKDEFRITKK